eukprot:scaffold197021_cov68-Attheya_sp.AAC.10
MNQQQPAMFQTAIQDLITELPGYNMEGKKPQADCWYSGYLKYCLTYMDNHVVHHMHYGAMPRTTGHL